MVLDSSTEQLMGCLGLCPALFGLRDSRFGKETCNMLDILDSSQAHEGESVLGCKSNHWEMWGPGPGLFLPGPLF